MPVRNEEIQAKPSQHKERIVVVNVVAVVGRRKVLQIYTEEFKKKKLKVSKKTTRLIDDDQV